MCYSFLVIISIIWTVEICQADNLQYTVISKTTKKGELCFYDCIDGYCLADIDPLWPEVKLTSEPCIRFTTPAPIYYTAQTEHNYPTCLSRCVDNKYWTQWCFVDDNGNWDLCSKRTLSRQVISEYEVSPLGPCLDDCIVPWNENICIDTKEHKTSCHPSKIIYRVDNSSEGHECIGPCQRTINGNFMCYVDNTGRDEEDLKPCAPSALPRIPEIFSIISPSDCKKSDVYKCGILPMIGVIEGSLFFETFKINEKAIKTVTIRHEEKRLGITYPLLPLVIRASVTRETLYFADGEVFPDVRHTDLCRNVNKMRKHPADVAVSLIGYKIGGKNETYNVIPVARSTKKQIDKLQNDIYDVVFYSEHDVTVNVTVLVTYSSFTTAEAVIYNLDYFKDGRFIRNIPLYYDNIAKYEPVEEHTETNGNILFKFKI